MHGAFAREPAGESRFEAAFDVREYGAEDRLRLGGLRLAFAATAHQQPCFAARVSDGARAIVYGADGSPSQELLALAARADLLVLEATLATDEHAAAHNLHMAATQAGRLAARAGAARLLLTHTLAGTPEGALREAAAGSFEGPVDVAREGWSVDL
jgi:ribonuclease BN (tRNA processing enzyme)